MNDPGIVLNSPSGAALAAALRAAARGALPGGALLRRDRGEGLFVTDAPRRYPDSGWEAALARAGFEARVGDRGLASLRPGAPWLEALAAAFPDPPDFLSAALKRFDGPPEEAGLALFALGAKALEGGFGRADYEKRLRQQAAVCLRAGGGGGLYACALLLCLRAG